MESPQNTIEGTMYIRVNDIRLFFDVEGAKLRPDGLMMREVPTLLLLHGGPGFDHSGFKPAFSEAAECAQVVYLDLRGNGRSDEGPPDKWSLAQWALDVREFCNALCIDAPLVLGHSLGGIVALVYATRYPDHPCKLILSSTSAQPIGERSFETFERLGGPRARAAAMAFWQHPDDESRAAYQQLCVPLYTRSATPVGYFERAIRNPAMRLFFVERELQRMDLLHQLGRVKCPTLVVAGEDDPITPLADSEEIAAALPPDLVRFERFAGAGHGVFHDQPTAFFRVLREFIGP
jgi:pimeloyl-ACP methyl ester carboxylesterase